MEGDRRYTIGLADSAWTVAARSQVLPSAPTPVALVDRGDLLYENYWQDQPLGGEVLRELGWDNTENPRFTYAEKAGPYNAAEEAPGGSDESLVLDVSFPPGATQAYASVSTVLPGADLSEYDTMHLVLRGEGVSGGTLLVYVEALNRHGEDADGDGLLDREGSAADPGFAITPLGGGPTRLGSNRRGESNARRDSEDRDGNGSLDLLDEGVAIAADPASPYIATLPVGSGGWEDLTVDIASLVRDHPLAFQDVRAIRVTVKPEASPTAAPVTGRVLVNGLWFAASGLLASSGLSAEERSADEDTVVRDDPFSGAYPGLYERLHGSPSWREENALTEKSLACAVKAPIAAGATEKVTRSFAPLADFSQYRFFRLYLYRPSGAWLAPDASLGLTLSGGGAESFSASLAASTFAAAWNEISVLLEAPWTVTVNGVDAGSLAPSAEASNGMLRRVVSASVDITAGAAGVPAGLAFWLDEWHLAECRLRLDSALLADVKMGYRGPALRAGGFPLVSDPFVSAIYEHRQGGFLDAADKSEDRLQVGLDAVLARYLTASFSVSRIAGRPTVPDSAVPVGLREDTVDRQSLRALLDAGVPWLPALEHRWERTIARQNDSTVTPTESLITSAETHRESLAIEERIGGDAGLRQSWSYTRSWWTDARDRFGASDGLLRDSSAARGLTDTHDGRLAYRWDGGESIASLGRVASYAAATLAESAGPPASWLARAGLLFVDPSLALPGAHPKSLQDRFSFSASVARAGLLGLNASWEALYGEMNTVAETGERDVSCSDAISLSLPVSPDRGGRIVITPEVSLGFTGSYRKVSAGLEELGLVFRPYPFLLLVPVGWLDPRGWGRAQGHAAADAFGSDARIQAAAVVVTGATSLSARLLSEPWYLPARARVSLRDETGKEGAARTQKRVVSFSVGKDARLGTGGAAAQGTQGDGPTAEAGTLTTDIEASFTRDYALKVRSLSISERWGLHLAGVRDGDLRLDHSISWARDRQSVGDPALSLFPDGSGEPGAVALRPDKDNLTNTLTVGYVWRQRGSAAVQAVTNTEQLTLENILAWTTSPLPVSSVPLRASFEHLSQIEVSDSLTLGLSGKAAAGIERRAAGSDTLMLPAVGFELGITARFSF
jgi:hypothetical protein